jgi:hypothetical protein
MKRHYGNYLRGLPNIKTYRNQLVTLGTKDAIDLVLEDVLHTYVGFQFERRKVEMGDWSCAV